MNTFVSALSMRNERINITVWLSVFTADLTSSSIFLFVTIYKQTSLIRQQHKQAVFFSCPLFTRKLSVVRDGQVGSTSDVVFAVGVLALMSLIYFTQSSWKHICIDSSNVSLKLKVSKTSFFV